jgi:stage IV sporulation protein FB
VDSLLTKKFPVFRVSGIQVYVHILFVFFAGFELYQLWATPGLALLIVATLWLSVLLHEFGHCWGARYQGGNATEILLWPLGGLALCDAPQTPWAQGFVAAAGPAVNVLLAGVGFGLRELLPPLNYEMDRIVGFHPIQFAAVLIWTNVALFLFNMIPAFPLDMGRIYQAILWVWVGFRRSMRIACYTTFICAFGLVVHAIADKFAPTAMSGYVSGGMTLMIALWVAQTAYTQLQMLERGDFDDADEPWRQTYRFHPETEPKPREPGFIAKWAAKREEAKQQRDADEKQARAQRLDDVLRRVAQVGTDGLTPEEKSFLEQESARLRDKR